VPKAQRVLIAACIACAAALGAAPAHGFRYTHSVAVSGQLVDSWTRTATGNCGLQGSGSTTIAYAWTKAWRVTPMINRYAGAHGRWVLTILLADYHNPRPARLFTQPLALPAKTILIADLPSRFANVTTTFTGGAAKVGSDCDPLDGKPCVNQTRSGRSNLSGVDKRNLEFDVSFNARTGDDACMTGTISGWSSTLFKNQSELRVRMPSPGALRRKVVTLTASDSGHQTDDDGFGTKLDETVTRSVTVTFKRLKR
jgi:hypothetical protein